MTRETDLLIYALVSLVKKKDYKSTFLVIASVEKNSVFFLLQNIL